MCFCVRNVYDVFYNKCIICKLHVSSIFSSVQRSFYEPCCRGRSRTRSPRPAAAGTVSTAASALQKAARSITFFARFLPLLRKNRGKLRKILAKRRQTGVKMRKKTGKLRNFRPKRARFAAILRKKESFSCTFLPNCAHCSDSAKPYLRSGDRHQRPNQ